MRYLKKLISILILTISVLSLINGQIVKGKVSFKNNDIPAIGATIYVKGTDNTAVTDINGDYQIFVDSIHRTLCFSFIGFKTKELDLGDTTVLNVILEEEPYVYNTLYLCAYIQPKKADINGVRRNGSGNKIDSIVIKGREFKVLRIEKAWADVDKKSGWKLDLFNYINYPDSAIFDGIEGTVYAKFMIDKYGNHKQLEIVRGVDKSLDQEVLKALSQMSIWTPIEMRISFNYSKYYARFFILPVKFRIQYD